MWKSCLSGSFQNIIGNVREANAVLDFLSTAEESVIPPIGPVSYGWVSSDLNPEGTVGEAHLATREKGKASAEHQAAGFIKLLRDVRATPLGRFMPTSGGPLTHS